jgi:uncharacterized protein YjbI with pentapeptide repeats
MSEIQTCSQCLRPQYQDDKCIFHCTKTNWYRIEQHKKIWDTERIKVFWREFGEEVSKFDNKIIDFTGTIFPNYKIDEPNIVFPIDMYDPHGTGREDPYTTFYRPIDFSGSTFLGKVDFKFYRFKGVNFNNVIFTEDVSFKKCIFEEEENIKTKISETYTKVHIPPEPFQTTFVNTSFFTNVDFSNSNFSSIVSFNNAAVQKDAIFTDVTFKNKITFYKLNMRLKLNKSKFIFDNTKFLKLADFWHVTFNDVSFTKTDFEGITVFTDTKFLNYFQFQYTKFEKQVIFNRTKILSGFDIHEAIFNADNIVYTDVEFNAKAMHKETYRLIKFVLDKRLNYIEADNYYAREMEMYRKESFSENKWNWSLLAFGKFMSNYGNSWSLPIFWMILSSLIIFFYMYLNEFTQFSFFSFSWLKDENFYIYPTFIECLSSKEFLTFLNPFSRGLADKTSVFSNYYWAWMSQKIIFGIGIYHLIIAVKRKTRR